MHDAGAAPDTVPDGVLEDLRARLHAFRPVTLPPSNGWSLGVEPTYFTELMRHWRADYDWRAVEARVRALPWVIAGAGDALLAGWLAETAGLSDRMTRAIRWSRAACLSATTVAPAIQVPASRDGVTVRTLPTAQLERSTS
ncbi:MAG: epoxide hydrolase N-terminal domain-containing protein [Lapillicoccus sp.]